MIGWLDCSAGVAGDMLLGALADTGALDGLDDALATIPQLGLTVTFDEVRRGGQRALSATVSSAETDPPQRRLDDIREILQAADLSAAVSDRAAAVFERLALAEARVHGIDVGAVHFHEVGAADAIADIVGACHGFVALGLEQLVASPISLGGGEVAIRHGTIPIPGPAVLELLSGTDLVGVGGPGDAELATPTGVALLAEWADRSGSMPAMAVSTTGIGAGAADTGRPNVVRLVLGAADSKTPPTVDREWWQVAANVDDLDPRLWPTVLDGLLAAGAADAWLAPIQMKKGRPAHTVHALVTEEFLDAVERALFEGTTTLGVRRHPVGKTALKRDIRFVEVCGRRVGVKIARHGNRIVTATPEWSDVVDAATAAGVAPRRMLELAAAEAARLLT